MAQGKKTQPIGILEVGDILFCTKATVASESFVAYKEPSVGSTQYPILSNQELGVIVEMDVKDKDGQNNTYVKYRVTASPEIRYVIFSTAYLTSKANPEYNYGDGSIKKTFDWSGLLSGVGGILQGIGGIFGNRNSQDQFGTIDPETGAFRSGLADTEQVVQETWIKRNGLYVGMAAILAVIGFVIYRDSKSKEPKKVGYGG